MNKIKDWIIHKLGGFTEAERVMAIHSPLQIHGTTQTPQRIAVCHAQLYFDDMHNPDPYLHNKMCDKIVEKLLTDKFIKFTEKQEYDDFYKCTRIVTRAELLAVK